MWDNNFNKSVIHRGLDSKVSARVSGYKLVFFVSILLVRVFERLRENKNTKSKQEAHLANVSKSVEKYTKFPFTENFKGFLHV